MFAKYNLSEADEEFYNAWFFFNGFRKGQNMDFNGRYAFGYWTNQLGILAFENAGEGGDAASLQKALDEFAAVYAMATSRSRGKKKFKLNKHGEVGSDYEEDHSRFTVREQVFNVANAVDKTEELTGTFLSGKLTDYLKNGCKSAAPKTEEEFVQWAGTGPSMKESLRKSFRITSDLREAYRNLIKACLPFIDSQENKVKAKKLYKTFYNFTALEWEIELPM